MQSLPQRRPPPIHLAQLEKNRIEEVVDDPLTTPHAMKTARGLPDEDRCLAHLLARPRPLRHQRRRKVLCELFCEMKGADAGPGHPLPDDIGSRDHNREHRPSTIPRKLVRPLEINLKSSAINAEMRPTPGCIRATKYRLRVRNLLASLPRSDADADPR